MPPSDQYFSSTQSSTPKDEPSRPMPDSFIAAEGRHLGRDQSGVDAEDAVLERLPDAPDSREVLREVVRREPVGGRVRDPDRLLLRSENRAIAATGPNVSSQLISISGVTPVSTEGWKNCPSIVEPPTTTSAPPVDRVVDVPLDLLERGHVDQRADLDALGEPVGDLERRDGGSEKRSTNAS